MNGNGSLTMSSNGIAEGQHGDHRSLAYYLRSLHREIGYFVLGLTVVYALSGILLVYRETDFLKSPVGVAMVLPPQMSPDEVGKKLRLRQFEVTKTEGGAIYFQGGNALKDGVYDRATARSVIRKSGFPLRRTADQPPQADSSKASHLIRWYTALPCCFCRCPPSGCSAEARPACAAGWSCRAEGPSSPWRPSSWPSAGGEMENGCPARA